MLKFYNKSNCKKYFNELVNAYKKNKIIIIPTDTIYGLTCQINSCSAIENIFLLKKRDFKNPLSILVSSFKMAKSLAFIEKENLFLIKNKFSNKKVTFITYNKHFNDKSKCYFYQLKKIGIRIINWKWLKELIDKVGPIFATSLNISGKKNINDLENIPEQFLSNLNISCIVDFGKLVNKESTVYDLISNKIIRK
jgi:L-threonylcarbamoyladenylate synthase